MMLLKYLKYYLTFVHIKIINPLACYLGFLMKIKVHSHEQILLFSEKGKKQDCELIFSPFLQTLVPNVNGIWKKLSENRIL